ncbi:MAG TPA: NlpC/P60 family protein [Micromonosporaceae bacterium]|nr:NlpC/P60 family protein [Micromonosporaceae bacterium]
MPSHTRRSLRPRLTLTTAVGTATTLGLLVVSGVTAHAEPTVGEIERQIDQAWNKLEPVIEQHNATRIQLAANKAKVVQLTKQIQPLQLQFDLATAKLGDMAAHAYMGGQAATLNALLSGGSPTTFAEQLALLDQVARAQQKEISGVAELKRRYEEQKRPIDELVVKLAAAEVELAAKAKQINTEIRRLQALRLAAYGSTGSTGSTTSSGTSGTTSSLRPVACPVTLIGGAADVATRFACAQIGKPYVWGADGPDSYDCSGLTMAAWAKAGVYLSHNAAAQRRETAYVSRASLRPGDLVFYYSDLHHVGMYVGGGWIVHASQAGVPVKMRSLDGAPIHSYGRPG